MTELKTTRMNKLVFGHNWSSEVQSDAVILLNSSNILLVGITRTLLGLSDESI